MTILEQGTLIASNLMPGGDDLYYKPEKQDKFSAYMGQVINGWSNFNSFSLSGLLDKENDAGITAMWEIIPDRKLIKGKFEKKPQRRNLINVDVTTAGYIHIPVCSPEHAYQSWDTTSAGSSTFYPCNIPLGMDYCGQATFEDQTSDA
ncbi:hypothetical protein BDV06DRAFT_229138 [Aspergillus oleicola]